jgi:hypothetical protein
MNQQQILAILRQIEPRISKIDIVASLYAETLAEITEKVSVDQLRRLLVCGAYLYRQNAELPQQAGYHEYMQATQRLH